MQVEGEIGPCEIGLYHVVLLSEKSRIAEKSLLVGRTEAGIPLTEEQCREILALPVRDWTEAGRVNPQWLKGDGRRHALDELVPVQEMIAEAAGKLTPAFAEETERLKLLTKRKKAALSRDVDALEARVASMEKELEQSAWDRLKQLRMDKQLNQLRRELAQKQENLFFDALRLDVDLEEQLKRLAGQQKLTAKVVREFVLTISNSGRNNQ